MIDQLCRVVLATDQAVRALRQGAGATAFLAALDQVHAAVHQLPRGLTEQVWSALLYEIVKDTGPILAKAGVSPEEARDHAIRLEVGVCHKAV